MLLTAVMAIAIALPSCGGAKKSDSSKSKPATVEESAPQADKEECSCGHCHASDAITVKAQEFVARTIIIMNNSRLLFILRNIVRITITLSTLLLFVVGVLPFSFRSM